MRTPAAIFAPLNTSILSSSFSGKRGGNPSMVIVFHRRHHPDQLNRSVKQILPPLFITLAEQAHEMAAGVEAERPWLPGQFETGFFRRAAALFVIAVVA